MFAFRFVGFLVAKVAKKSSLFYYLDALCIHFGIITILDSYPACTLTFLEIPVYSIYELNKSKGHKDVNQFKEQDEQLLGQIHSSSIVIIPSEFTFIFASELLSHDVKEIYCLFFVVRSQVPIQMYNAILS
jgi:hypothetical protein